MAPGRSRLRAPWFSGRGFAGSISSRPGFRPRRSAGRATTSIGPCSPIARRPGAPPSLLSPRHTYPFPPLAAAAPLEFGPFLVRVDHLIMLVCALALAAAVHLALYHTRFGL